MPVLYKVQCLKVKSLDFHLGDAWDTTYLDRGFTVFPSLSIQHWDSTLN